jgi:Uma2 family endonuclease
VYVYITHTDIDKNRLYAAMGVPEFWRYNGEEWLIYQLQDNAYIETLQSTTFPIVTKADLYQFLEQAQQEEIGAGKALRNLIKARINNL